MQHDDLQILRYAALELQANGGDLIRVAGVVQRLKDWWATRKNRKALKDIKDPVENAFKRLETAVRSQDAAAVDRITSEELPNLLTQSVKEIEILRDKMLSQPVEHVNDKGEILSGNNLSWVAKNYQKDKSLVQKLWEMLPEAFRSEVPVGKRIGQPISNFSWYNSYSPQDIYISNVVKENIWRNFSKIFDSVTLEHISSGFDKFLENLKSSILTDSILVQVNFSPVSEQVGKRHSNEMRLEVQLPEVSFPVDNSEILIHIDKIILTDLGTRIPPKHQLSVLGVWFSSSNKTREYKIPEAITTTNIENSDVTASDGPITKIIKKALLKKILPNTQAVIKVNGNNFDYNVQFAKILASALRQEIDAECSVRNQNDNVEIQVDVYGNKITSLSAIFGISKYLSNEFFKLTKKAIDINVLSDFSKMDVIKSEVLDESFRKVAFDCWRI
jgi:hypothetical protein